MIIRKLPQLVVDKICDHLRFNKGLASKQTLLILGQIYPLEVNGWVSNRIYRGRHQIDIWLEKTCNYDNCFHSISKIKCDWCQAFFCTEHVAFFTEKICCLGCAQTCTYCNHPPLHPDFCLTSLDNRLKILETSIYQHKCYFKCTCSRLICETCLWPKLAREEWTLSNEQVFCSLDCQKKSQIYDSPK